MDNIIKNKYGYYSVENMPIQEELEKYYKDKYYQETKGSYEAEYDADEIAYFKNKIERRFAIIKEHLDTGSPKSFLDIGSGEGWALKFFKDRGYEAVGLDFSSYGCEKFNPDCLENLIIGDVYTSLNNLITAGKKFDVIYLDHLLEHVIDPERLVIDIKKIIQPGGVLVIEVPNDFSIIQNYLWNKGCIDKKYWLVIPDHLSYFNKEGLENLLSLNGWESITYMGDYPIDWNLLNQNTNYINNPKLGKSCHRERIEFENLLHTLPMDKVISFYKVLCDLGFGREILGFFKPISI